MKKTLREAVIAGNWKMNKNRAEARAFMRELIPLVRDAERTVVVCVPYTDLETVLELAGGTGIRVGAENCHWASSGAFTGEISAEMLREMGVEYVIVGHSERRRHFGETNETVRKRVRAALDAGLKIILCVGETPEERDAGITKETIAIEVRTALRGVTKEETGRIILAYEPIWAIGTGKTATAGQAEKEIRFIRELVGEIYDRETAGKRTILYGGSVTPANCGELLSEEDIDGALVGGSSLRASDFAAVVGAATG